MVAGGAVLILLGLAMVTGLWTDIMSRLTAVMIGRIMMASTRLAR